MPSDTSAIIKAARDIKCKQNSCFSKVKVAAMFGLVKLSGIACRAFHLEIIDIGLS